MARCEALLLGLLIRVPKDLSELLAQISLLLYSRNTTSQADL